LRFDPQEQVRTIDQLLGVIASLPKHAEFDEAAERTLHERRAMLWQIPALTAMLPPLTTQILHGDYSLVNLMFSRDALVAVVDFQPPSAFLIAYELGRIAFTPQVIVNASDWLDRACLLVGAYLTENPQVSTDDVVYSGRVALLQLLKSLYGVKEHYLNEGLLQADLDAFWLYRHQAAQTLLECLDRIEVALRAVCRGA
jgi:homoserine kinase type II